MLNCWYPNERFKVALAHGAGGAKGAKPSFKDHMATVEGQAELRAFVKRVEARFQQDWNKVPAHLRGGALCISHRCVWCMNDDELEMHLSVFECKPSMVSGTQGGLIAGRSVAADDAERKVALLLQHGVRADRLAAERYAAAPELRRLSAAGFQHRIELLRMYGCALDSVPVNWFRADLHSRMLPLLAFLVKHECASPLGLAIGMPCYRCCAACGSCFAISMIVQAHCCLAAQTTADPRSCIYAGVLVVLCALDVFDLRSTLNACLPADSALACPGP